MATVGVVTGNALLQRKMAELGFKQAELAKLLNDWLRDHGEEGTVSDRVVRYWLTGKTRRPWRRTGLALQAVFGCSLEELGFEPPARPRPKRTTEQPVNRRSFLNGTTAAAASPLFGAAPSIGFSEVATIRRKLDALNALDQEQGGLTAWSERPSMLRLRHWRFNREPAHRPCAGGCSAWRPT